MIKYKNKIYLQQIYLIDLNWIKINKKKKKLNNNNYI